MKFELPTFVLLVLASGAQANLRSWALGLGKGSSAIAAIQPGSASNAGKQYQTCYVSGKNAHKNEHSHVWFSPECSGSGYWKMSYNTDWGTCVMFGDTATTGCPFTSFWTSKPEVVIVNKGSPTKEYTDPKGITFIGCSTNSRVELSRNENRYCSKDAPAENCKTMTSGSILSFLCP